jgi:hypothetical protein
MPVRVRPRAPHRKLGRSGYMIVYELTCNNGHRFEGWFDNASAFDRQSVSGEVCCPVCHSPEIRKLPSANRLIGPPAKPAAASTPPGADILQRLRDIAIRHYEDVGSAFPDEARKIHYGEAEERRIRGTATGKEVKELVEDGIAVLPIPTEKTDKTRLN